MLFHESHFREVLNEDQSAIVAKLCNQIINSNSKVFYGTMFSDGRGVEFSTEKKRVDTHVMLGVDISLMGTLTPSEVTVALDRPTDMDYNRTLKDRVAQLERELRLERSKK